MQLLLFADKVSLDVAWMNRFSFSLTCMFYSFLFVSQTVLLIKTSATDSLAELSIENTSKLPASALPFYSHALLSGTLLCTS